jgi:hypothetical protein
MNRNFLLFLFFKIKEQLLTTPKIEMTKKEEEIK